MSIFSESSLAKLREKVRTKQTEKRFTHTLGVEEEAAYIGSFYLPNEVGMLRAAALLHDLTKCTPDEEQIALCEKLGIVLTEDDCRLPQTLHGKTAVEVIKKEFPDYAIPCILQAVEVHTTGSTTMSTFDKIIFLSDYIEAGRQFQNCITIREAFHKVCSTGSLNALDETLVEVMRLTINLLMKKNIYIAKATFDAYRALSGKNFEVDNG